MLYQYSDKKLCSCPPSVDFFLLTCQLAKTNIEGGGKAVPTYVTRIVACTTEETIKPLVKSVCEPLSKTLFWGPTRIWVCTMTVRLKKLQCIIKLPTRLRGNSKPTSGNSLSLLRAQNKDLGTASQMLLARAKLQAFSSKMSTLSSVQPKCSPNSIKGEGGKLWST